MIKNLVVVQISGKYMTLLYNRLGANHIDCQYIVQAV